MGWFLPAAKSPHAQVGHHLPSTMVLLLRTQVWVLQGQTPAAEEEGSCEDLCAASRILPGSEMPIGIKKTF